ncbi:hypothetical protein L210DRAFT_961883 [Boletus edulis BED1]|uniref:Uncharacterized protein n=1 Tax=Boletus edulis BED1 TaxID=1328754 RepID=A0AAD4BWB8_BOLED|nr:hypothetical protein L210DRAFT_961883 [Boletus edulis BED1]
MYPSLRHFEKGISKCKQWMGGDQKPAGMGSHTEDTLKKLEAALKSFHQSKAVFVNLSICTDFNILKIHSMNHYTASIYLFGSADGFNTEVPECLHIDLAKWAYRASNRQDYVIQMTTWLQCQDYHLPP